MLIRICGHFVDNPNHIDKLIAIKGLPEDWIFRASRFGGKELVKPWEADIDANIPESIRHLCEPFEYTTVFPPIEKGRDYVWDTRKALGIRFNYMTEPGQELWEKIERYLDGMTPRDQKVPSPVLAAPDQRSGFNPHRARRTVRGSLELIKADIPLVELKLPEPKLILPVTLAPVPVEKAPEAPMSEFACATCNRVFDKKQALVMHTRKAHKEKVGV